MKNLDSHTGKVVAPFTRSQVLWLNRWQRADTLHAFTCGNNRHDEMHTAYQANHGGDFGQLVASKDGWYCPVCGYKQLWAHDFMTKKHVTPTQLISRAHDKAERVKAGRRTCH